MESKHIPSKTCYTRHTKFRSFNPVCYRQEKHKIRRDTTTSSELIFDKMVSCFFLNAKIQLFAGGSGGGPGGGPAGIPTGGGGGGIWVAPIG